MIIAPREDRTAIAPAYCAREHSGHSQARAMHASLCCSNPLCTLQNRLCQRVKLLDNLRHCFRALHRCKAALHCSIGAMHLPPPRINRAGVTCIGRYRVSRHQFIQTS